MNAMPSEAARGGALKRPGVRWASMLEHVVFVETEFGLPADASEREKRAHLAGLERAKLRREAIANGAGAVARKPEGKGRLCKSTDAAARGGHLEVLKWLRSQDDPCPWDEETCYCAALGGHLEVLHWLRSQEDPCPWDESICGTAFCDWLCLNPISAQAVLESN